MKGKQFYKCGCHPWPIANCVACAERWHICINEIHKSYGLPYKTTKQLKKRLEEGLSTGKYRDYINNPFTIK